MQTTNYGTYPRLASTAWTHSGYQITYRSLMRFELGSIPPGSTVQSATLYLYSDPANSSGEISNQSLSGANSVYFQKVTQAWDASTVTWNTQHEQAWIYLRPGATGSPVLGGGFARRPAADVLADARALRGQLDADVRRSRG